MDGKKILVADDQPNVTLPVREWLEANGYLVRTAPDGHEALRAVSGCSNIGSMPSVIPMTLHFSSPLGACSSSGSFFHVSTGVFGWPRTCTGNPAGRCA